LSESTQNQLVEVLAEAGRGRAVPAKAKRLAAVRTSPGGYFATAAVLTFAALVLLRVHRDLAALILIASTWTIVPLMLFTDRLNFDGQALSRSGLIALLSRLIARRSLKLNIDDVERVEVSTLRTLRRGGSVRYRYRVEIAGREQVFTFASGGEKFRQMVKTLLPRLSADKLDARACELRDHLEDVKVVRAVAARLGVASLSVLEQTQEAARKRIDKRRRAAAADEAATDEAQRAILLRKTANDLRIAGRLRESAEAFRRTLLITPHHPWLIYEYARLLRSQASAFGDARLLTRACAALRLGAMRGSDNASLLERIGESFLEYGQPARAAKSFRKALDLDEETYRSQLGLAEVGLSEGKLAHVIHHYSNAARVAPDQATARLARREADYYERLNNDEDYLAAELRRMTWLDGANRVQQLTARVSFAALLIALVGSSVDQVVAGLGWAFASSAIIAWSGSLIMRKLLATRGRVEVSEL
jgi:tetratricopeptide (TPR) repeat protein